jgi:outer membrane protein assembly factor BamB
MRDRQEFTSQTDLFEGWKERKAADYPIDPTALIGTWADCDKETRGLLKIVIASSRSGITVHSYGACSPSPCDWGTVPGIIYASNVSSDAAVAFSAHYKFSFKTTIVVGHLDGGALIVETFDCFTDGSRRSNYYSRYYKCKCTAEGYSAWPMFHRDVLHTGQSPFDTSGNAGKLKWSLALDSPLNIDWSPAIGVEGTIYMGGGSPGKLYAVNPDGTLKWVSQNAGAWTTPAICSDGTVCFGSDELYAVNANGILKWSFYLYDGACSDLTVGPDGTLYIGSDKLYAINPDGTLQWEFTTLGSAFSSPAIASDGTLYFGSDGGILYATRSDGTLNWSFPIQNQSILSSPALGFDGSVYFGGCDNNLYALNPDGTLKWVFATGSTVQSSPAIGPDGSVYCGSFDNNLYALSPDGGLKWKFTTGGGVYSSAAVGADGTIYFGSSDNNLYALGPDGGMKWKFTTDGNVDSSPAIGPDGSVYFGSDDSKLYALR